MKPFIGFLCVVRRTQKNIGLLFQMILLFTILNLLGKNLYSSYKDRHPSSSDLISDEASFDDELSRAIEESQRIFEEEQSSGRPTKLSRRKERELVFSEQTDYRSQQYISRSFLKDGSQKVIDPPPSISEEEIMFSQDKRLNVLRGQCRKLNLGHWKNESVTRNSSSADLLAMAYIPNDPLYQSLLVAEKYHLSYCPVVGSGSNWMSKRMLQVIGSDTSSMSPEDPLALAIVKFPFLSPWSKYLEILESSTNLLVVRHPFDRLIEAYKRIFEEADALTDKTFKLYAPFIIKMYRHNLPEIIYSYYYISKKPTFEEFCRFIIDQKTLPIHNSWKSIMLHCTPCHIPYNAIIHYDTMFQEAKWLLKRTGNSIETTEFIYYKVTPGVRLHYFSKASKDVIEQLHEHYKVDFLLFGFSVKEYLH